MRERFMLAQLAHPNVVAAYDAGESGGLLYFVMEFVDGMSFATLVKQLGTLPVVEASELIGQAAVGLQHIHEHGLVHRDIKPSNLLLTPKRSDENRTATEPSLRDFVGCSSYKAQASY
jgi:serine/threonine protein kinase